MDDMNEYLPIFLQESYDYINLLNNNLVLLEQDPSNKQALAEFLGLLIHSKVCLLQWVSNSWPMRHMN